MSGEDLRSRAPRACDHNAASPTELRRYEYEAFQRLSGADTRRHYPIDIPPDDVLQKAEAELERIEQEQRE